MLLGVLVIAAITLTVYSCARPKNNALMIETPSGNADYLLDTEDDEPSYVISTDAMAECMNFNGEFMFCKDGRVTWRGQTMENVKVDEVWAFMEAMVTGAWPKVCEAYGVRIIAEVKDAPGST